jgi:hypothetical protein
MAQLPSDSEFTGSAVTEGGFKGALTQTLAYLRGLLGTSGAALDARNALGLGGTPVAYNNRGNWATATAYAISPAADYVVQGGAVYACAVAHTSGTFATDLAAGKWYLLQGVTAAQLVAPTGASLVGYGTTNISVLEGSVVNIFSVLSSAEIADIQSGGATIDVSAKINSALASNPALRFPRGAYLGRMLTPPSNRTLIFEDATFKIPNNSPAFHRCWDIRAVQNITMLGSLIVNGNKANQTAVGNTGHDGIVIAENCVGIYIQRYYAYNCSQDGLHISSYDNPANYPQGIHIGSVVSVFSARNNVSITGGDGIQIDYMRVFGCTNGDGTGPADGLDIEPNGANYICRNINIGFLHTTGNAGRGVSVLGFLSGGNYVHENVNIQKIYSAANGTNGVAISNIRGLRMPDLEALGNPQHGVYVFGSVYDVAMPGARLRNNGYSGACLDLSSAATRCGQFDFRNVRTVDNNTANTGNDSGLRIIGSAAYPIRGIQVDGLDAICAVGTNQKHAISINDPTRVLELQGLISAANNFIGALNTQIPGVVTKRRGFLTGTITPGLIAAGSYYSITVSAPAGTCVGGDIARGRPIGANYPAGIVYHLECIADQVIVTIHNASLGGITPPASTWFIECESFY